jgi:serine/threonine-protein kinase
VDVLDCSPDAEQPTVNGGAGGSAEAAPDEEELVRTVERTVAALKEHGETVERSPGSTIVPARSGARTAEQRLLELVARAGPRPSDDAGGTLAMGETLGEGAMGVVRSAVQLTLARKVAVKTLRASGPFEDTEGSLKLLREAWITGAIEHPNVVPVHEIGWSGDERPLIVLKHIEGASWAQLIDDEPAVRQRFGRPLLEWNLGVLIQVCNAVAFAHSRGFLHRDLKPDNVMIGAFGEVYVLDWGIAVALTDSRDGRFPLASEVRELAGTPAYMAPEMLNPDETPLGEPTDGYLLGAILYQILTGRAPHAGVRLAVLVSQILRSRPEIPEAAPAELTAICRRAMAVKPGERFGSVLELRRALESYLEHRASSRVESAARERLGQLVQLLASPPEGGAERQALYEVFSACRFGFQQALDAWPESVAAREGLREAVERMVAHEIAAGDPRAARVLFAELAHPSKELRHRLEEAERAREAERGRIRALEDLDRSLDFNIGGRRRAFVILLCGVLWTALPLFVLRAGPGVVTHRLIGGSALAMLAAAMVVGWWGRKMLTRTLINRRIYAALLMTLGGQILLAVTGSWLGLRPDHLLVLLFFHWTVISAMVSLMIDPRVALMPVMYASAFITVAKQPAWCLPVMAVTNGASMLYLVVRWFPSRIRR